MKYGMYIITLTPISTAYIINPYDQSVYVYPRPSLGNGFVKTIPLLTNTHAKTEELIDVSFSMRSVSYQIKVGDQLFPELPV
jgi:hypothetical protein